MSILFLEEAEKLLGYTEDNPRIADYLYKNGYDIDPTKTAWCAAFVGAVLNACGYEGTHKLNARSYLNWGIHIPINEAMPGDIVILKRGLLPWQGHIGFKCRETCRNGRIQLFGGNQDDRACTKVYDTDRVIGVRREGK